MVVTEEGMVTPVKPLQWANALLPMVVTEGGMVTPVKLMQWANAWYPMVVTGKPSIISGMFTVAAFPVYLVIITLVPSTIQKPSPLGSDCAHNAEPAMKIARERNSLLIFRLLIVREGYDAETRARHRRCYNHVSD
jgi:hypothetical protein